MKINVFISSALLLLTFIGCSSEPSLQKYFVDNSEKKDFIVLDVSSDILNLDKTKLSETQKKAMNSFNKMNILAFSTNNKNQNEYETERKKITSILKDPKYQELMRVGSGKDGASISYVGSDENINEFVIFANRKENGFAIVRVLGENMNPNNVITLMSVLQQSKVNMDQLKPLQELIKK